MVWKVSATYHTKILLVYGLYAVSYTHLDVYKRQVTNLYQNMRANALTDAELRRKAADELTCMTCLLYTSYHLAVSCFDFR